MKISICGFIEAEGSPEELVLYSSMLLDCLRQINEKHNADAAKKEVDDALKLANMTFEQLRKSEMGDEGKE